MEYKIDELIVKHLSGTLSDKERVILDEWKSLPENRLLLEQLSDEEWVRRELRKMAGLKEENAYHKLSQIYAQQAAPMKMPITRFYRSWYVAAAVFVVLAGAGLWFLLTHGDSRQAATESLASSENRFKNDVSPGGDRATLILGDNSVVILDSATNGVLSQQGRTQVVKLENGQIAYQNAGRGDGPLVYNTIKTPKGGQYMVLLPDGSKAWLNSASSLRFPAVFAASERIVDLQGEGYFEVRTSLSAQGAGNKEPFIVKAGDIRVQVLGTHFNVNAYTDEEAIKTTLLEGSVKVSAASQEQYLKPGQQVQADRLGGLKTLRQADVEQAIAWHNGIFAFRNASIVSIMRQAQRWYDIEVVYEGKVNKDQPLNGDIPRNVVLSQLLKILEATGSVHFRIEGKKVTVMP